MVKFILKTKQFKSYLFDPGFCMKLQSLITIRLNTINFYELKDKYDSVQ